MAANNLWQFRVRNIFSVTIICLSFLFLGIFLALSNNLRQTAENLSSNMVMTFFLEKGLTESEVGQMEAQLRQSHHVADIQYISTEKALERFRQNFPELRSILDNLKANPFPASLEAKLAKESSSSPDVLAFIQAARGIKGIEDVQFNRDWIEKMQSLSRLAKAVGFFLGGILILASFFIISNVIKLNVFARKNEIEILRLVGATNLFIRIPFILEGIVLGILGSALSLALLFLVIKAFPLYLGSSLGALQQLLSLRILTGGQSLWLVAGGAAIGILGSVTSVSRFLKV
ncbi:MAG: permease-like cell division protein FtsX [Acidobacteriota bacterium]|nr:permease-like cell division protein FtsX [Acidobacteriota bacterium]